MLKNFHFHTSIYSTANCEVCDRVAKGTHKAVYREERNNRQQLLDITIDLYMVGVRLNYEVGYFIKPLRVR